MVTVFVIAFIACTQDRCHVSYPDLNRYFPSYDECITNLKSIPGYNCSFDPKSMVGMGIICLERSFAIEPWRATEATSVRNGPSQDHKIIGTIKRGQTFFVIGHDGKWLKILTEDGRIGYCFVTRAKKEQ
ncbi:MAG: SH3 domain-containing protein [Stellaceae bacterium]